MHTPASRPDRQPPKEIHLIGNELALLWQDGSESYFSAELLRKNSPSAENRGERDLLGRVHGGIIGPASFPEITIEGWENVGNYAIRLEFNDGHKTGIYSWGFFRELESSCKSDPQP